MYSLLVQTPEIYMYDRKRFYFVTIFRQLTVYMQGAKKLSQLYSLPFGQAVASMHQDEQDWLQFFCNLNSPKNVTCLLGKLKTEFTDPIAKSTSPRLSDLISLHAAGMYLWKWQVYSCSSALLHWIPKCCSMPSFNFIYLFIDMYLYILKRKRKAILKSTRKLQSK